MASKVATEIKIYQDIGVAGLSPSNAGVGFVCGETARAGDAVAKFWGKGFVGGERERGRGTVLVGIVGAVIAVRIEVEFVWTGVRRRSDFSRSNLRVI